MPVFISHKREDSSAAADVAFRLSRLGIPFYFDAQDHYIGNAPDLTLHLQGKVQTCTHLMAVVSRLTVQSWWVPFEIGVATQLEKRISTFATEHVDLPDYLTKWPVLRNTFELDKFAALYVLDQSTEVAALDSVARTNAVRSAEAFHRQLKSLLGQ